MPDVALTWLGHSAFRFDSPGGKRVYVDPFLHGNPKCPEDEQEPERVDLILVTHGHDDHVGDTVALHQRFDAPVVAQVECRGYLATKGCGEAMQHAGNKGGTIDADGSKITFTDANHSSGTFEDGKPVYLGEPAGLVVEVENGTKLYFAGDTNVFASMQLIGRIYEPDVAIIPIGDHFTMGPREAAVALELLGVKRCVPCHYGTFGLLTGTPEQLRELAPDVELLTPEPGGTVTV
jgi:L-ascorbate metabolism protein UlaG (beta-lactamase superfamily)